MVYWGVHTNEPANLIYPNSPSSGRFANISSPSEDQELTLLEQLRKHISGPTPVYPDFWGRYLDLNPPISEAETQFIFHHTNNKCRILLIYNGTAKNGRTSLIKGDGRRDARTAISLAEKLPINRPKRVAIYADIEPGTIVYEDWIKEWWDEMDKSPFAPGGGFYADPNCWNFKKSYCRATQSLALPSIVTSGLVRNPVFQCLSRVQPYLMFPLPVEEAVKFPVYGSTG